MSETPPIGPDPVVIPGQEPIAPEPPSEAPQPSLPPETGPDVGPSEAPGGPPFPGGETGRPID